MNHAQTRTVSLALILAVIGGLLFYWLHLHKRAHVALPPSSISESQAIKIATQYVKEKEPDLDISRRAPVAGFYLDSFGFTSTEKGAWSVSFGIPSPPGYSRPIITHTVQVDRYGHVVSPPLTTSP